MQPSIISLCSLKERIIGLFFAFLAAIMLLVPMSAVNAAKLLSGKEIQVGTTMVV